MKSTYGIKKMSIVFIMFSFFVFHAGEVQRSLAEFCETSKFRPLPENMIESINGMLLAQEEEKEIWYKQCVFDRLGFVRAVCFNSTGLLFAGSADRNAAVLDVRSKKVIKTLSGSSWVRELCFKESDQLITGCADGNVSIWDIQSDQVIGRLKHPTMIGQIRLDKKNQIITSCDDGNVRIWDPESRKIVSTLSHPDLIMGLCVDNQGQLITACGTKATTWDLENQKIVSVLDHPQTVCALCLNESGKRQLITGCYDYNVRIWDIESGLVVRTFKHPHVVYALCLNKKMQLVTGCYDGSVRIWDPISGQVIKTFRHLDKELYALSLNEDETQMAVATGNNVYVWQLYQDWTMEQLLLYNSMRTYLSVKKQNKSVVTTAESYLGDMARSLRLDVTELSAIWNTFGPGVQESIWQKFAQLVQAYGYEGA